VSEGLEPLIVSRRTYEPLFVSLACAANQCRDYAAAGAPTTETLTEWADLFDRAVELAEWNERPSDG
jgi:hypothetical protein